MQYTSQGLFRAVSQYNQYASDNGLQSDIHILTDEVYPLSWTEFSPRTERLLTLDAAFFGIATSSM